MRTIFHAIWRYLKQTDQILLLVTLTAAGFGLLLVYSATHGSSRIFVTQILGILIGCVAMIAISKIDYHDMAGAWKWIAIASVFLLALTLLIGSSRAGSQDRAWIRIGSNTIQPAEFIKAAFVITFAKHCDLVKEEIDSPRQVLFLALHGLVPIAFLILQKDMGMMLVFTLMFLCMMYAANVKLRYFSIAGIALLIASPLLWAHVLHATQNVFCQEKIPKKIMQPSRILSSRIPGFYHQPVPAV
ncbi:MAG: FtsW/RodA/SpoVE family cell cycle protein [Ethanoligenens sp.]